MPIIANNVTVHLGVFDMPTSVAFYRDVLGFSVVNQTQSGDNFEWGLLRLDDAELMLNTQFDRGERPAEPDRGRVAAHEDTTLYFGCPDVDAAYEHVRSRGLDVKPPAVSWYGMKQVYMKDPDGYLICFQSAVISPGSR